MGGHPHPVRGYGQIVRVKYTADPATEYWIGVFSYRPTLSQLNTLVGDPSTTTHNKPWDVSYDELRDLGLLMAYGSKDSPCGYFPQDKTDDSATLTGRWEDDQPFEWATDPYGRPVLFIAEFAAADTYLEGRFYNAPLAL